MTAGFLAALAVSTLLPAETLYLNLERTLALALRNSPLAVEAKLERKAGVLAAGRGVAGIVPKGSVSISKLHSESGRVWEGEIAFSQAVFDPTVFSGVISGIMNAGYHSESAREQSAGLVLNVTGGYLNLIRARSALAAAEKACTQAEAVYRLVEEKFRLGQVSRIELLRSQAFYQQSEVSRLTARKGYTEAMNALASAVGLRPGQIIVPTEELDTAVPEIEPEQIRRQIERNNPGVRMSRELNRIAVLNLVAAFLRVLPAVSLFRSFRYVDTVPPAGYRQWQEGAVKNDGIAISLPVADIAGFVLNAGEALISARRSRAALVRARLELRSATESAIAGYQEARQRYRQAVDNLRLHRELYELARSRFQLGALGLSDLLEVEAGLAQAEAGAVGALCDVYLQSAQLGYLMGLSRTGEQVGN
ncbi:MAG: TolC family protein [candidate division WOR-3 bacterium]|nr:TolC family protein [candidate division WOR-3 bacterium]